MVFSSLRRGDGRHGLVGALVRVQLRDQVLADLAELVDVLAARVLEVGGVAVNMDAELLLAVSHGAGLGRSTPVFPEVLVLAVQLRGVEAPVAGTVSRRVELLGVLRLVVRGPAV